MTKMEYEKIWWGEKWLEAFDMHSERSLRGKKYAQKGYVLKLDINKGIINAKVQGSEKRPYNVEIDIPQFSAAQKIIFQNIVISFGKSQAKSIGIFFFEKAYEMLESEGIELFPSSWRSVNGFCSCPDEVRPCKHMAAVVYEIAHAIDKNPQVIFKLRGCELETPKNIVNFVPVSDAPRLEDILDMRKTVQKTSFSDMLQLEDILRTNETVQKTSFNVKKAKELDFSKIPYLLPRIRALLGKKDPNGVVRSLEDAYDRWRFFNKGIVFEILLDKIKKVGERSKKSDEEKFALNWGNPETWKLLQLIVDDDLILKEVRGAQGPFQSKDAPDDFSILLATFLRDTPNCVFDRLLPEIQFLIVLYNFLHYLMKSAALIPQMVEDSNKKLRIRWVPALFDTTVQELYDEVCSLCPPNLVTYKGTPLSPQEQVNTALFALAFGFIAEKYFIMQIRMNTTSNTIDPLEEIFYTKGTISLDKQSTVAQNQLQAVHRLIYPLSSKHAYQPNVIVTAQEDDTFKILLGVSLLNQERLMSVKEFLTIDDAYAKIGIITLFKEVFEYIRPLKNMMDKDECAVLFTAEKIAHFFEEALPSLKRDGIRVILPTTIHIFSDPKLTLSLKANEHFKHERSSFLHLQKMLDVKWEIGNQTKKIDVVAFKNANAPFVRTSYGWAFFNKIDARSLSFKIEIKIPKTFSSLDIFQAALLGYWNDIPVDCGKEVKELTNLLKYYDPVPVPKNLKAILRPYQERGFQWLMQNIETGFGSILADDMGLGKTIQVIATILHCKNKGYLKKERVLVIAPAGLLSNWKHELERFAPGLSVGIYHGQKRDLVIDTHDVIITSYGLARQDRENFEKTHWFMCVIDEAQNIKNPRTQQTLSIKNMQASHKIALTGTPVENRLLEYWSIFDFVNEGYLGTAQQFSNAYAYQIEEARDKECLKRFQTITNPFMLRRLKSDKSIINDLPDKIENTSYCSLTKQQKDLYTKLVDGSLDSIDESDGIKRKGLILKLITALKQVCNHPAQYEKETRTQKKLSINQSGKMQLLEDFVENIYEAGEKVLIFTQYTQMGDIIVSLLEERFKTKVPFLYGGLTSKARDTMVRNFQENPKTQILVVSLKAGGTGLNLTAANHVIHYDLWWNPAVEAQATDRAHRIGQSRNVMVHRLLTTGTFEERINEMIQSKKELADLTVGSGESWITEMSTKQLKDLLRLRQVE